MPGVQQPQPTNANHHTVIHQNTYHSESHSVFMISPQCYLLFSSTMELVINTLTQAPDLMTLQAHYFPQLSDFGRDDLFLNPRNIDIQEEAEAIEILAGMPQTIEEIPYADYPHRLFSLPKQDPNKIAYAPNDENDGDYVLKKGW